MTASPSSGASSGAPDDTPLPPLGVLFVCTGNICRSPSAHGVFEALLARHGLSACVRVDSAATHDYHIGAPPDPRSVEAALRRGVDLRHQRARLFTPADAETFDYLLAMDGGHYRHMQALTPASMHARIQMFLDYAPSVRHREVPDPYYGGEAGFERVLDMLEAASQGFLEHLLVSHADRLAGRASGRLYK